MARGYPDWSSPIGHIRAGMSGLELALILLKMPVTSSLHGANLITNPSFKDDLTGWILNTYSGVATMAIESFGVEGDKSLKITSSTGADAWAQRKVTIAPSQRYAFLGFACTQNLVKKDDTGFTCLGCREYDANDALLVQNDYGILLQDQDWAFYFGEFVSQATASYAMIECCFSFQGQSTGIVWWDNLRLSVCRKEPAD